MQKSNFLVLVLAALLFACSVEKVTDPYEYIRLFDDAGKGLMEEKSIGDITFGLHYKTPAYMAIKANKEYTGDVKKIMESIKNYEEFQYYTLRIKVNNQQMGKDVLSYNSSGTEDYTKRVQYFSFDMQKDIKLVCDGDTLPCSLFQFERNYGITDYSNFLISFPISKNKNSDRTLVFDDKFLGAGVVKLTVKAEDLNKLPNFN